MSGYRASWLLRGVVVVALLALAGCVYGPGYYGGYPAAYGYAGPPVVVGGGWYGGWGGGYRRGWR